MPFQAVFLCLDAVDEFIEAGAHLFHSLFGLPIDSTTIFLTPLVSMASSLSLINASLF
jgi:hypothetical protein